MRRQWYIGFGIFLLFLLLLATMAHDVKWFMGGLVFLAFLWIYDRYQVKSSILRNFPILGHFRYFFEFLRPEIQQYLIANNEEERPFNRETRSVIYQRAKNVRDTIPFGTEHNIRTTGYTWVLHSLVPKDYVEVEDHIIVGGPDCTKPYKASRLNISAMSFGALSANALMALNNGARIGGFAHNTGEGGLSPYHLQGGDLIFQIGTGYFGCRNAAGEFDEQEFAKEALRDEVKMIELKLSQGAKPSHGGILPAAKVSEEIAKARKVRMGEDVISPPAHSAFSTPKGLLEFIAKLRTLSGGKPVGFKLCIGRKDEFLSICKAMLVTKIYPDFITVDGAEGGTGAAPMEFSDRVGEPLEDGLVFVHNALVGINVREHIRIICSGKTTNGFDMVLRIALGADLCNSARAMMMAIGCVQSKQCDANTCPTGVATQNLRLQKGLVVEDKQYRVANYHKNTMKSFREIVGAMGLNNPNELSPDYIMRRVSLDHAKTLSEIHSYLKPGELLQEPIPPHFKHHWELADPEKF